MKIFSSIKLRNTGDICQKCTYFQNDPAHIEEIYPELRTMSSGYASVRQNDGLCEYHQIYLAAGDSCPNFSTRPAKSNQLEIEKATAV